MKKMIAVCVLVAMIFCLTACNSTDYKEAKALFASGNYEEALPMFEALGDYEDSAELVKSCKYNMACNLMLEESYLQAMEMFTLLGDYEDSAEMAKSCNYKEATALMAQGEYADAAEMFEALGDYEDSAEKMKDCHYKEIDELLQGTWIGSMSYGTFKYEFNNGSFKNTLTIGTASADNQGGYRIDLENQEIYVCYNYTYNISSGEGTPNDEEKLLLTYTYDGTTLELASDLCDSVVKQ